MAITAVVRIKLPRKMTVEEATPLFEASAPRYRAAPGLVRKYYLLSEDGLTGGGIYLFESRAAAAAVHDDAWRAAVKERYGTEPEVEYFETPVIVDNELGAAKSAA